MKKVTTEFFCDVCKKSGSVISIEKKINMPLIFTTEQTEGRNCKPYLTEMAIDICTDCKCKVMSGRMIFGSGAQGHNKYYFKKEKLK